MSTPYPRPLIANYTLGLLLLAYILSFVDRNVMAILVGPIRETFGISDVQFSLLHGWAFTLFYIVLGVPIGWLADRVSRKLIIVGGVFFWSVMTCLCGVAKSFGSLFAVRTGVGVGEATLSPAAYSLMSDMYPPDRLRWATAIFTMGITLGTGASYMIGGWLFDYFSRTDLSSVPLFGTLAPWQATFVAVGLPGLLLAALLLLVREPERRRLPGEQEQAPPFREVLRFLGANRRVYASLMLGVSMMSVVGYGSMAWFPETLLRNHGVGKREAGAALGMIFMVGGTLGSFAGAAFASWLQRRGYEDANMRLVMLAALLLVPLGTLAPLMPTSDLVLAVFALVTFVHYTHFGVSMAALQVITPSRMRAQTSAIMLFCTNLFGLGLGGTIVALFTDGLFGDDQALKYSLALCAGIFYPLAALCISAGLSRYRVRLAAVTLRQDSRSVR